MVQHNDFGPWNVFRRGRDLTVIDWELGDSWRLGRSGPALCDLLYFALNWSFAACHLFGEPAQLQGFAELFLTPDRRHAATAAVYQEIATYVAQLGIDRRFVPVLLVCTWVERALDQAARRRALGEPGADARSGNRFVPYVVLLGEHVDMLFASALNLASSADSPA